MATFPNAPLPIVTELLINGAWTDITADVREDPGVTIGSGRSDESQGVSPSTCDLVLGNLSGAYSNRLPSSTYFGLLGRNTQLRHRIRWVYDAFGRTASSGWASPDTGPAWTTSGGSASDYSVSSGSGRQSLGSTGAARRCLIDWTMYDFDVAFDCTNPVVPLTDVIERGFRGRRVDAANFVDVRLYYNTADTVSTIVRQVVAGVETTSGFVTVSGVTTTTALSVRVQAKGATLRCKVWAQGAAEPDTWTRSMTVTFLTPGSFEAYTQIFGTNTLPVVETWDNLQVSDYRFWGEVPQWPQTWDISGADVTAPLQAAGVLRRLGTGAKPLRSALYRTISGIAAGDYVPDVYLPMEDGSGGTQIASGLPDGIPMAISGAVELGNGDGPAGSAAAVVFPVGSQGFIQMPVYGDTGHWAIQFAMKIDAKPLANTTYVEIKTIGSATVTWRVELFPGVPTSLYLNAYDASGSMTEGAGLGIGTAMEIADNDFYGHWLMYTVAVYTDGAGSYDYGISYARPGIVSDTIGTSSLLTTPPGRPVSTRFVGAAGFSAAHLARFVDPSFNPITDALANAEALDGWVGETAADRMARLCREEGVPFTLAGNAADTQLMGPQQIDTLLANLEACQLADQGILGEPRDAFGLQYRTLRSMLNQVGPALDYSAGRVAPPLEPTEDDQLVRNRVTASRIDGSSATAELTEGSLSTQDSPLGVGLYDNSLSVNAYVDGQLPAMAGWQVRLGTWDEARFPQVTTNHTRLLADGQAALAGQIAALDGGGYFSITNPPAWLPPDAIELIVQGCSETHRGFERTITFNAVPAGPYNAFVIGDQTDGRLDTSGCLLNEAVTSGATSAKLCVWDGPPSITSAARAGDFPFDLSLRPAPLDANAGERVRATAMAAVTAATFVAAGTSSSGSSGSRTPALPAGAASGDLILIFASTRNSGTGTVDTPTGWTELLDLGNASLLGRIYDGVWTMPTVTVTGGAANEDTLAQSAALRSMCVDLAKVVHSSATQLNGSAQNIATPLLGVRRDNCVILYLGWKQDDYTSVATISGATEIQELSSAAGNDASQVWDYKIQTTRAGIDETSFVVTGGAAAISRSAVVALVGGYQAATLTRSINTVAKAWPAGTQVSLWRPARPAL